MENAEICSVFSLKINALHNSVNDITTYVLTSCTNRAIINFIDVRGVTTNTQKAGNHLPPGHKRQLQGMGNPCRRRKLAT
jgi:hypothetical protein